MIFMCLHNTRLTYLCYGRTIGIMCFQTVRISNDILHERKTFGKVPVRAVFCSLHQQCT